MFLAATIMLAQLVCRPIAGAPNEILTAGTKIKRLAVKVTTLDLRGAGTDNAVYFDVGPWSWRLKKRWRNDFDPASFVRSLRLQTNDALPWHAKLTGFFTTPLFKRRGISGWLNCPEEKQTAEQPNRAHRCLNRSVQRERLFSLRRSRQTGLPR